MCKQLTEAIEKFKLYFKNIFNYNNCNNNNNNNNITNITNIYNNSLSEEQRKLDNLYKYGMNPIF